MLLLRQVIIIFGIITTLLLLYSYLYSSNITFIIFKSLMHVINLFKKHKLIPRIIDELKEIPFQISNDNLLKSYSNTNSICVLHNNICELFGENVYI